MVCRHARPSDVESYQQHNVHVQSQTKSGWRKLRDSTEADFKGKYTSFQNFLNAVVEANGGVWGIELMVHANRILKNVECP